MLRALEEWTENLAFIMTCFTLFLCFLASSFASEWHESPKALISIKAVLEKWPRFKSLPRVSLPLSLSLSLSPPATSKGVRVAACLEGVLDSYARRAQAGGVTVSQQKHLICPASQRLPAVIVQPAYCHPGLYYCTLSRSAYHYSLLSNNSSLIWCAAFTVVADPIRRPSTAIRPSSF